MNNQTEDNSNLKKPSKAKGLLLFSWALFALLGLILIAIYYAFVLSPKQTNLESFKSGVLSRLVVDKAKPLAPNDVFLDENGQKTTLADFKGSYTLVNVWATWCAPCIREMPALADLSQKYSNRGLKIIAISLDRGDKTQFARDKLKKLSGEKLKFYNDPQMRIAFPLKAKGLPVSVIYDKEGKEIARIDGAVEWQDKKAHQFIENILGEYIN